LEQKEKVQKMYATSIIVIKKKSILILGNFEDGSLTKDWKKVASMHVRIKNKSSVCVVCVIIMSKADTYVFFKKKDRGQL
jgi:hypothetical protein